MLVIYIFPFVISSVGRLPSRASNVKKSYLVLFAEACSVQEISTTHPTTSVGVRSESQLGGLHSVIPLALCRNKGARRGAQSPLLRKTLALALHVAASELYRPRLRQVVRCAPGWPLSSVRTSHVKRDWT